MEEFDLPDLLEEPMEERMEENKNKQLDYKTISEYKAKTLKGLILRVALISGYFARSTIAGNAFKKYQTDRGCEMTPIVSYSPTRWGGLFDALTKFYKALRIGNLQEFLQSFLPSNDKSKHKKLIEVVAMMCDDMEMMKQFITVLYPYYVFTKVSQDRLLTLGEGFIQALSMVQKLSSTSFIEVDLDGKATSFVGQDGVTKLKTITFTPLLSEIAKFKGKLLDCAKERLFTNCDDSVYISLLLSPSARFSYRALTSNESLRNFLSGTGWAPSVASNEEDDGLPPLFMRRQFVEKQIIAKTVKAIKIKMERSGPESELEVMEVDRQQEQRVEASPSADVIGTFVIKRLKTNNNNNCKGNLDFARLAQEEYDKYQNLADGYEKMEQVPRASVFFRSNKLLLSNLVHVYLQNATGRPSSAIMESFFSVTGNIMSDTRTNMEDDLFMACAGLKISTVFSLSSEIKNAGMITKAKKENKKNENSPPNVGVSDIVEKDAYESDDSTSKRSNYASDAFSDGT